MAANTIKAVGKPFSGNNRGRQGLRPSEKHFSDGLKPCRKPPSQKRLWPTGRVCRPKATHAFPAAQRIFVFPPTPQPRAWLAPHTLPKRQRPSEKCFSDGLSLFCPTSAAYPNRVPQLGKRRFTDTGAGRRGRPASRWGRCRRFRGFWCNRGGSWRGGGRGWGSLRWRGL